MFLLKKVMNTSEQWSKTVNSQINPQDNFFSHVNSKWIKNNPIPDDMSRWGMFNILDESNKKKIKQILLSDKLDENVKILYHGYLNSRKNKSGYDFLFNLMDEINSTKNIVQFQKVAIKLSTYQLINNPVNFYVYANLNDSNVNILYGSTGGVTLPDRDYYLESNMKDKLEEYQKFINKYLLKVAKITNNKYQLNSDDIINYEKMLAGWTLDKVKSRDPKYYNNETTYQKFKKDYPNIEIDEIFKYFNNEKPSDFDMNIGNPNFYRLYNEFLSKNNNLKLMKQHLLWSLMLKLSLCDKKFEEEKFEFFGKYLSGLKEMKPVWKRSIDYINSQLGELLGLEFCKIHFPPESKETCKVMVKYIIEELNERLKNNNWMDNKTKENAVLKLSKMNVKIGYPNKNGQRDFSQLKLNKSNTFIENHCQMNLFDYVYNINEMMKKKNKDRFHMYPHMVNAYYSPVNNEIVFPAGILQFPFFNKNADTSENFGAIGAVIGHEITHGFDDQGRKYDGNGNLNDWWSEDVINSYKQKTDKIRDLFSNFDVNGKNINGELTLGENIADLGGLSIAYHAYIKYLKDHSNENIILEGYTCKQRFFLSFGRVWCSHMRDEEKEKRILTDPHSPPYFRVNGTLMNMTEFYKAFNVTTSNKLYLKKELRGSVW